jgi:hypothetical protein
MPHADFGVFHVGEALGVFQRIGPFLERRNRFVEAILVHFPPAGE